MVTVSELKNSQFTLREMPLPILVVCDAPFCASPQRSARVLVLAQRSGRRCTDSVLVVEVGIRGRAGRAQTAV